MLLGMFTVSGGVDVRVPRARPPRCSPVTLLPSRQLLQSSCVRVATPSTATSTKSWLLWAAWVSSVTMERGSLAWQERKGKRKRVRVMTEWTE